MQDFQRSRLYRWEDEFIHRRTSKSIVEFDNLQCLVDYVWKQEGLKYPPKVKKIHKNNKVCLAKANRMEIFVPEIGLQTTILLHEIAHSMTAEADGGSNKHCERYVGVYLKLLDKYGGFDLAELCKSADEHKIKYNFKGAFYA